MSQEYDGYDVESENYNIIRQLLMEKFGNTSAIKSLLCCEFEHIKRNDRDWKEIIEAVERILQQLKVIRENLDHSNVQTIIKKKLFRWILANVYERKQKEEFRSTEKLRSCLRKIARIEEDVA